MKKINAKRILSTGCVILSLCALASTGISLSEKLLKKGDANSKISIADLAKSRGEHGKRVVFKADGKEASALPYANDFTTEAKYGELTYIDANSDDISWDYSSYYSCITITAHWQHAMDDWAVTPGLQLEAGKTYRVSAKIKGGKDGPIERIEVKYGKGNTSDALDMAVIEAVETNTSDWKEIEGTFVAGESGTYYVGYHAISDADSYNLYLKDIKIEEDESAIPPVTSIAPPYVNNLLSQDDFDSLTQIDANDDGIDWDYSAYFQYASIDAHWQHAMDDWLVTPALQLEKGKSYEVTAKVRGGKDGPTEKIEVKYGKVLSADNLVLTAVEPTIMTTSDWVEVKGTIVPDEDGDYYVGFHAISDADTYRVCIKDIAVSAGESVEPPVQGLTPPFEVLFDTQADFDQFSIIDGNEDGVVWDLISFLHSLRISYNSQLDMDDWVVTPALYLESGKAYRVSCNAKAGNDHDTECIEVKYGKAATAEALTQVIVPATDLTTSEYVELGNYIYPSETGIYYIGFHGISKADTYQLHLDDIRVSEGVLTTVPGVPQNFKVTPDASGAFASEISLNAPTEDFEGRPLTGKMAVEIKRGNVLVHRAQGINPGDEVKCNDVLDASGRVIYTAYAANEFGVGNPAEANVHIGFSFPAPLASVAMTENPSDHGMITLSWPEIEKDDNGLVYPADKVAYLIYEPGDYGWNLKFRDIEDTQYEFRAVDKNFQTFVQFAVCGFTEEGQGDFAFTGLEPVGTPFPGFSESFTNGGLYYPMITQVLENKGMEWKMYKDDSGISSQDNDNGFLGAKATSIGDKSAIASPKISLKDIPNPVLSFFVYNFAGDDGERNINKISVEVREAGKEYKEVLSGTVDGLSKGNLGWNRVNVDLADYTGKQVQFRIVATCEIFDLVLFDNIRLDNSYEKDLSVIASAPQVIKAGSGYDINVTVRNEGMEDVENYKLILSADGIDSDEIVGERLNSGNTANHVFKSSFHPLDENEVTHTVRLVVEGDCNADNDITEAMTVKPEVSNLPRVTNLVAGLDGTDAKLVWDEPDLNGTMAKQHDEDFEAMQSWSTELEGWVFVDVDKEPVGGFKGMTLPGIDQHSLQSFFIFDATITDNSTFSALSGNKYMASLFRADQGTVDDWAISPELSGNAQTISFYAMSYSPTFPEYVEIYYSTGSVDVKDFKKLSEASKVPGDWTKFETNLPAGAKRFAIRSCGTDTFMLMIDDVNYETSVGTSDLEIVGYNLYKNRELVNKKMIRVPEYTDSEVSVGKNDYVVTAVYMDGESAGSNVATLDTSSVTEISEGIQICQEAGKLIIKGACGKNISVNSVDGITLYRAVGADETAIELPQGVYILTIGEKTYRIRH